MGLYKQDTEANRRQTKYSRSEQFRRLLWAMFMPLFRFSPRVFFDWRNMILRLFGAQVGRNVHIYNTVKIQFPWNLTIGDWSAIGDRALIYNLGPITVGEHVTISQHAHLCAGTHDYSSPALPLIKAPVIIEDQAWICADAFIGPGVTVGEGAIVGARAVAVRDVEPWDIVVGNPARFVKKREH